MANSSAVGSTELKGPILHVIVVGFHHKKGCQVEYSFPPMIEGAALDSNICPAGWKYLPTLALPDGSHNFDEDTVYFHLPSLTDPKKTVYGISCFRQIPVEKLKNRTADITRGTVQKSVCVLSSLPLYGHIQVKMALITHAYFDEGDFSKVKLLHDTYHHLNSCLVQSDLLNSPQQLYVGLSARDFILQFRHKTLLLFKLLLLERRLVFYRSPVQPLCASILTLLSLYPGMIERGLHESACVKPSRPMSPIPEFSEGGPVICTDTEANNQWEKLSPHSPERDRPSDVESAECRDSACAREESDTGSTVPVSKEDVTCAVDEAVTEATDSQWVECDTKLRPSDSGQSLSSRTTVMARDPSTDILCDTTAAQSNIAAIALVPAETCGTPLPLFTQGYLCHPYLSLPYLDLLSDVNVRGYVVGATNILFKQKKQLADVLIEVEGARVETQDPDLRRQLHLTTEDLRFADFIVRHVSEERHDVFLDGVGWEGGDEWVRTQFRVYLLCLMRTSLLQDGSRELEHFNSSFMNAWKATHNYKMWVSGEYDGIWKVNPGHPFAGQLSVADMKLRLSHTMQNTEGGRKLNQAMVSTGRAVATTGRAVGGAISQAKGALSSWWTTFTTVQSPDGEMPTSAENSIAEEAVAAEEQENVVVKVAGLTESNAAVSQAVELATEVTPEVKQKLVDSSRS